MPFPLPAIILAAPVAILVQNALPKFDTEKSCRSAFATTYTGVDKPRYESCIREEKDAGEKIGQGWAQFPATDRSHCAQLAAMGDSPSYVEMLTCLEIARDTKKLPESIKRSGIPK